MNLEEKERIEIEFWRDDPAENPREFTRQNLLNKIQEARHLDYKLQKYKHLLKGKTNVLEIGAGQGWASCYMKKYYLPEANFTVSDISTYAIQSLHYWEHIFQVKMLNSLSCPSYDIPLRDQTYDLIFCYAAAHHFVKIEETLVELKRLLTKNGVIIFLYEPTCSKMFYPLHYWYVNYAPHSTPEDVLQPGQIKKIAEKHGLSYQNKYDSRQTIIRSVPVYLYFRILGVLKFLQRIFPSSSDMIFKIST